VVGCNNARVTHGRSNLTLIKELIKNDVIVLVTGAAHGLREAGLLTPKQPGNMQVRVSPRSVRPLGFHLFSTWAPAWTTAESSWRHAVVKTEAWVMTSAIFGRRRALEWMSEKAVAIGHYFVASGVYTVFGQPSRPWVAKR